MNSLNKIYFWWFLLFNFQIVFNWFILEYRFVLQSLFYTIVNPPILSSATLIYPICPNCPGTQSFILLSFHQSITNPSFQHWFIQYIHLFHPSRQRWFLSNTSISFIHTGTALLVMTSVEIDTTGASYYGEQSLHFMSTRGESNMVSLGKSNSYFSVESLSSIIIIR